MEPRDYLASRAGASALDDSDAAALAAAAYKDRKTGLTDLAGLPGWTILGQANEKGGYDATVVHHAASNVLVIANRGTEGFRSFDDWRANVEAALEKDPRRQVIPALTFLDRTAQASQAAGLAPRELLIVGHSLGGALGDIQAAFAKAVWPGAPPTRMVGIASAGFASSVAAYAAEKGWTPAPNAQAFITHYARGKDAVPHHAKRKVFGTDRPIASIWQCFEELPSKGGAPTYWADTDFLRNHDATLYWRHLAVGPEQHLWYSRFAKSITAKPGGRSRLDAPGGTAEGFLGDGGRAASSRPSPTSAASCTP